MKPDPTFDVEAERALVGCAFIDPAGVKTYVDQKEREFTDMLRKQQSAK